MQHDLDSELKHLDKGDHLCPLHERLSDQVAMSASMIRTGLERGERCVYVAEEPTNAKLVAALNVRGVDVPARQRDGALHILPHREVYIPDGTFSAQRMLDYLRRVEASSYSDGFSGLRYFGEMTWALSPDVDSNKLIEYEVLLNTFIASGRSLVMCNYHRKKSDQAILHDVIRTHPLVIFDKLVCSNPYYDSPELLQQPDPGSEAAYKRERVKWWISRLTATRESEIERETARETLQEKEEHIRLLLDSTAEAIYGIDLEGRCTFANQSCASILGYADSRYFIGRNMHEVMHHTRHSGEAYPQDECHIFRSGMTGEPVRIDDEVFWRADGTSFEAEYFTSPIRKRGEIVGAVVTFLDVSDRKTLEDQLRQSQKMEAIGRLAGGIAHDFNNVLMIVTGTCDLLLRRLSSDDPTRRLVKDIKRSGDRAAALTRQLLTFSRKQVVTAKVLDLNLLIRNTEPMLRRIIGEDVTLVTVLQPRLDSILADSGQLEQVLMNLTVNSRDAMPTGGRNTIETRNVMLEESYCRSHPEVHPGHHVLLAVTDTGTGMSDETRRRIFEPFYTTKAPGEGTGLGLSVVHGIVEKSQASIDVQSEPEKGTTFNIYFPSAKQVALPDDLRRPASLAPDGNETILIAEDDDGVRGLMRRILEDCGYTVLEADRAEAAIGLTTQHHGKIDLLITDVVMPGLGGRALAEQIVRIRPEVRVLYVSGYTDDAVLRYGVQREEVAFLQKPFTAVSLALKLREVLKREG